MKKILIVLSAMVLVLCILVGVLFAKLEESEAKQQAYTLHCANELRSIIVEVNNGLNKRVRINKTMTDKIHDRLLEFEAIHINLR